MRTLRAGTRFTLSQAPLPKLEAPDYPGFNALSVKHLGINNRPKPATHALAELLGDTRELLAGLLQEMQVKSTSSKIAASASSHGISSVDPFGSYGSLSSGESTAPSTLEWLHAQLAAGAGGSSQPRSNARMAKRRNTSD